MNNERRKIIAAGAFVSWFQGRITKQSFYEWTGTLLGLLGAFLLATNTTVSPFGWVAFLFANFSMIRYALGAGARGLLVQQVGFVASSCLGLYRVGHWPF